MHVRWLPCQGTRTALDAAALCLLFASAPAIAQSITTSAGGAVDDGRPAIGAAIRPTSVAFDGAGNLVVADVLNHRVIRIDKVSGTVLTIAGNRSSDFYGDGGPATLAGFRFPACVDYDAAGNLYICDWGFGRIRRVDAGTGVITTFAGGGNGGDGVPATQASLSGPNYVALDGSGNLLVNESSSNRVRRIDARTGLISTVAGNGEAAYSGDGGPATGASLNFPHGVAVDRDGNLYICDRENFRVRKVDASTGAIRTMAGTGVAGFSGDGGPATLAQLISPQGPAVDGNGNVYFADGGRRVRRVDARTGVISTVAGDGTDLNMAEDVPALSASFGNLSGVRFDKAANLLLPDTIGRLRKLDLASNRVVGVAGNLGFWGDGGDARQASFGYPRYIAVDRVNRCYYVSDGMNMRVRRVDLVTGLISTIAGNGSRGYSGDGAAATQAALSIPSGVAVDDQGNVLVADSENNRIRRVEKATGRISTVAGNGRCGADGEGSPATVASLCHPLGVAVDRDGSLFIADSANQRIRRVDSRTRAISTLAGDGTAGYSGDGGPATAARIAWPEQIALDGSGNILFAEHQSNVVRLIDAATGTIRTIAGTGIEGDSGDGGPATSARLHYPTGVAVTSRGDVYIADTLSDRIRKVDGKTGVITRISGDYYGYRGDGGPALTALMFWPVGLALDEGENLFLVDTTNARVRLIQACQTVSAPAPASPPTGAQATPVAPILTWQPATGASSYDVFLDTEAPPRTRVASDLRATSLQVSDLAPGKTYYWSVLARGDPFCVPFSSAESAVQSFTTAATCTLPRPLTLAEPAEGATVASSRTTLSWQPVPGADRYDVLLGPKAPLAVVAAGITATSYLTQDLAAGAAYTWGVVAHATCDATQTVASATRTFRVTGACQRPASFTTQDPPQGATGQDSSLTLQWGAAAGAATYDVYLGLSADPPLYLASRATTSAVVSGLLPATTYHWRVVARTSCDDATSSTPVASFVTTGACPLPAAPLIVASAPGSIAVGQTYVIAWKSDGASSAGGYLVERAANAGFSPLLDSQLTTWTAASFVASGEGRIFHRVRAVAACDASLLGPESDPRSVTVVKAPGNVVFTVPPAALMTAIGERVEEQRVPFTIENVGSDPVALQLLQSFLPNAGSDPTAFFTLRDPAGGSTGSFVLQPRQPKTFEVQFQGIRGDTPQSLQGLIVVLRGDSQPLPIAPYAYVNVKVGAASSAAPQFFVRGTSAEYAAFDGFTGEDSSRPPLEVEIKNTGTTPMELGTEIGPEVWLEPETAWNASPIPAGASRTVRLYTRRVRALAGSALPRYTYFTVRTRDGRSARLLVQDNEVAPLSSGRSGNLGRGERSMLVPWVAHVCSGVGGEVASRVRLSNAGTEDVQAQLIFTPAAVDGFDPSGVKTATVVVPRSDVITLVDPVVQLFGLSPTTSGTLEVRAPAERIGALTVTSAVDVPSPAGGGFGFPMATAQRGEGAVLGVPHAVGGITASAARRTHLFLAETSGVDGASVRVTLYDQEGNRLGERTTSVLRYGLTELLGVVPLLVGAGTVEDASLEIEVLTGGGAVLAVAVVADNTTNDAVAYASRPEDQPIVSAAARLLRRPGSPLATVPRFSYVLPQVLNGPPDPSARDGATLRGSPDPSRSYGAPLRGSPDPSAGPDPAHTFRTELTLLSPTRASVEFKLTYLDLERGTTVTKSRVVGPRKTAVYRNVLEELFGVPSGTTSRGPIFVKDLPPSAQMRARLVSAGGAGDRGDAIPIVAYTPGLPTEALTGKGFWRPIFLDGLEQSVDPDRGSASLLTLTEVLGKPLTITVSLFEAGNRATPIAEKDFTVPANGGVTLATVFSALDLDTGRDPLAVREPRQKDRVNVLCVVTPKEGEGVITGMVTMIDNETGDLRNAILTPVGGVPATGTPAIGF